MVVVGVPDCESYMSWAMQRARILANCDYCCSRCEQQFGQQRTIVGANSDRLFCKVRGEVVDVVSV